MRVLFRSGRLSQVVGLELADRRQIVIKVRPFELRLAACLAVQRALNSHGFPCSAPPSLVGAMDVGQEVSGGIARLHSAFTLGRYCSASAMCGAAIESAPVRSAIVRASLSTRWTARAERRKRLVKPEERG